MSANLNEVWDLISQLNPQERRIIYKRLNEDIRYKLNDILDKVNERAEESPLDIDEITHEVESVREVNYEQN